ncbi:MAG: MarR family winged helix-turn-helix transcriptional regulator [Acidimicrobiia bacterium]
MQSKVPLPNAPRLSDPSTAPLGDVASRLRLAVMRLSRRLRQHAPVGITQSQLSALATIVVEERITLSGLADAERVQPPSITRLVDVLVSQGYATRTPSAEDRRVAWVAPTEAGRALIETVRRQRDAYLAQRLRTLTPDDRVVLARAAVLLERLTEDPQ